MARRSAPQYRRGGDVEFGRESHGRRSAPPSKRRGGGFFSFLFSLVIVLGALAGVAAFAFHAEVSRAGPAEADKTVTIEHGSGAGAIGATLQREGAVRNGQLFRYATMIYARGETLKAGEYVIPAHASVTDIVSLMSQGRALQHAVTIPEGYTVAQAMDVILKSEVLTGPMPPSPPEGSILPETYHVQRGMTREALVQQMRDARDSALAEIWARRAPDIPIATPEQAVILASIVERETGVPEERPRVASVFTNRLRIGMALQTDPTVIYGVCVTIPSRCRLGRLINERTGEIRPLRRSELDTRTIYNTYKIAGLPPTPIANPGRAALEAVVNPAQTQDLYFVATEGGRHVFATNIRDHEANVARWRVIERQRLAQEAAEAAAAKNGTR